MVTAEIIINRIQKSIPTAEIRAQDLTGGGDHWRVQVKAEEFRGKSLVEQHQMIYQALGEMMRSDIHALALETKEK